MNDYLPADIPNLIIPRRFADKAMMELATDAADLCVDGIWPNEICFVFSNLDFIRPTGIAFLNNLIDWLAVSECEVYFQGHYENTRALRFLDDSQFFTLRLGHSIREDAICRNTTYQLERVTAAQKSARMDFQFLPWMARRLDANPNAKALLELKSVLIELFNNISDHTQFDIGCICAQHFPKANEIEIAIADFGLGIPRSVAKEVPDLDDADAIVKAVTEGFTTKGVPTNMGQGLYLLKDVCADLHNGSVTIFSGFGMVKYWKAGNHMQCQRTPTENFCPGTVIKIIVDTNNIDLAADQEDEIDWDF